MSFKEFTLVPQLDHSPRLVAFAQTAPGKLTLVALFAPLLFLHGISLWWLISISCRIQSMAGASLANPACGDLELSSGWPYRLSLGTY